MEAIDPTLVATKTATTITGFVMWKEPTGGWYKHRISSSRLWPCQYCFEIQWTLFAKARSDRTTPRRIGGQMLHSVKHQTSKMVRTSLVTWRFNVTLVTLLEVYSLAALHNGGGTGIGSYQRWIWSQSHGSHRSMKSSSLPLLGTLWVGYCRNPGTE